MRPRQARVERHRPQAQPPTTTAAAPRTPLLLLQHAHRCLHLALPRQEDQHVARQLAGVQRCRRLHRGAHIVGRGALQVVHRHGVRAPLHAQQRGPAAGALGRRRRRRRCFWCCCRLAYIAEVEEPARAAGAAAGVVQVILKWEAAESEAGARAFRRGNRGAPVQACASGSSAPSLLARGLRPGRLLGHALGVHGGGGYDEAQVGAAAQHLLEQAQQQV